MLSLLTRRALLGRLPIISVLSAPLTGSAPSAVHIHSNADFSLHQKHLNYRLLQREDLIKDCVIKRHKSNKKKQKNEEDEDEDQDEIEQDLNKWKEDDPTLDKDSKVEVIKASSMRADAIIKQAMRTARNKVDILFYENKIRRNGKKLMKKSSPLDVGDEVDLIKGFHVQNPNNLTISRFQILEVLPKKDGITLTVRTFKSLTIENYEEDPFVLGDSAETV